MAGHDAEAALTFDVGGRRMAKQRLAGDGQQVGHVRADSLGAAVAKGPAGGRVEIDDPAHGIHGHHCFQRRRHHGIKVLQRCKIFRRPHPVELEQPQQQQQQRDQCGNQKERQRPGDDQRTGHLGPAAVRHRSDHLDPGQRDDPRVNDHRTRRRLKRRQMGTQGVIRPVDDGQKSVHESIQPPDALDEVGGLAQAAKHPPDPQSLQPAVKDVIAQPHLIQRNRAMLRRIGGRDQVQHFHFDLRQRPLCIVGPRFSFAINLPHHIDAKPRNPGHDGHKHSHCQCQAGTAHREKSERGRLGQSAQSSSSGPSSGWALVRCALVWWACLPYLSTSIRSSCQMLRE